jgi:hypothetical protein
MFNVNKTVTGETVERQTDNVQYICQLLISYNNKVLVILLIHWKVTFRTTDVRLTPVLRLNN